jgi:hypothetical protein
MAMVWLRASSRKSSLVQGKLRRLKRKLTLRWRKLKLLRRLMRPRCERVECSIVERDLVKNILARLRHYTF